MKQNGYIEVPNYGEQLRATKAILAEREKELLTLKGHCSHKSCTLHFAHSGPCR